MEKVNVVKYQQKEHPVKVMMMMIIKKKKKKKTQQQQEQMKEKKMIRLRKEQQQQVKQQHRQKEVQVKKVNIPLELIVINREQRMCMNIMIIMRRQGRILQGRFKKI